MRAHRTADRRSSSAPPRPTPTRDARWLRQLQPFRTLNAADQQWVADQVRLLSFADGAQLYEAGQQPTHYVIVGAGTVRVHQLNSQGREVVFYRLGPGNACVMTASALLERLPYAAYAVAEGAVEAVLVPAQLFERLMAHAADFRRYVLTQYARQTTQLVGLIGEYLDDGICERLARTLLRQSDVAGRTSTTHEQLAAEVGTAREVISRTLKTLEKRGVLRRHRGAVHILDRQALQKLAGPKT